MRLSKALGRYRQSATDWHTRRDESHRLMKADTASPPWNGRRTDYDMIYEITEENAQIPPDETVVQRNARAILDSVDESLVNYVDALITRDIGNQKAAADVVIDGVVVASQVPAVALIALENDFRERLTLAREIPEAPVDEAWEVDGSNRLLRSKTAVKLRTAKRRISRVVSQPTQFQPAIVDTFNEDVPVARQQITRYHGGMLPEDKRKEVAAAEKLFLAFQHAREEANAAFEVEPVSGIGRALLDAAERAAAE